MGYTLSASDRDKLQKVIKDVNALTISKKQGRSFNQYNREYTYVKLTENVLDGGNPTLFWYASEVGFDTAGLPVVKTNGKVWSVSTNPLLIEGAEGAVDDILRVEPSALSDGSLIWLAIKPAGGGDTKVRLKVKATATSASGAVFLCDIIDNAGTVLTANVNVRQNKFTSAKFYINEIIYGDVSADGEYIADPYLAGIGVG